MKNNKLFPMICVVLAVTCVAMVGVSILKGNIYETICYMLYAIVLGLFGWAGLYALNGSKNKKVQ